MTLTNAAFALDPACQHLAEQDVLWRHLMLWHLAHHVQILQQGNLCSMMIVTNILRLKCKSVTR